jgi:hypothetical protein
MMLCCLVRIVKKVQRVVVRTVSVLARNLSYWARRAWKAHRERVATDATYAALTALALGGMLGTVPFTEVLAAVLAAALGVYMNAAGPGGRGRWNRNDDWDFAR